MNNPKWGLVGIGNMGDAIAFQQHQNGMTFGIYHPTPEKCKTFQLKYLNTYILLKEDLQYLDYLILALPADQIVPFIQELESNGFSLKQPILINMATSKKTKELQHCFPTYHFISMKLMGHINHLKHTRESLFVTNSLTDQKITAFFSAMGHVVKDDEEVVLTINQLATYHAIKAAKELEIIMKKENLSSEYIRASLQAIVPEVIRAYVNKELGHFGQTIAKKFHST